MAGSPNPEEARHMPDPKDDQNTGSDDSGATPAEETLPPGDDESAIVEQPTTEDLAAELNQLEEGSETSTDETAPDQPAEQPKETDAPSDGTDPPEEGTDPAESETEPPDPGTTDDAQAVDEPGEDDDRTIAQPLKTQAPATSQADKKAADAERRKAAIAAAPKMDFSDLEAEEERKAEIFELLAEVDDEEEAAQAVVDECHEKTRELMGELYPHTIKSDRLVDAVRGHIAAQKKIRAHRATNPERLKELLKQAGKAPIDAAFHVQRARGMARPKGPGHVTPAKPPEKKDQGDGSNANAGQE